MKTKAIILTAVLTLCLIPYTAIPSFAQDTTSSASKQPLNYYKIEVGMGILNCPVLPPRLKDKLMGLKGIKDYNVDMKNPSILFNIPEGVITKEQIVTMAMGCGFPAQTVNVLVDSKPFENQPK